MASSYRAIASLSQNFPALFKHFENLSNESDSSESTVYKGLERKKQTTQFVEDIAVLKDCLGQLAILSEALQKKDTTII